jgi:cytochrome P450
VVAHVNDPAFKDFSHMTGTDIREKEKIWAQMQKLDYLPYSEKFGGFYIVSRYAHVKEVAMNAEVFSVASGISIPPVELGSDDDILIPLEMDPPQHTQYRKILLPFLTSAEVRKHEESIRQLNNNIINRFKAKRAVDFVQELCLPLPSAVTIELLKFPVKDADKLDYLINGSLAKRASAGARECAQELSRYVDDYLGELRNGEFDSSSIASVLAHARIEGQQITPREQRCMLRLLIFGGFTTTTFVLAEMARWLAESTDRMQKLCDDPSLMVPAVDEFVRYASPGTYLARTVRKDFQLRGYQKERIGIDSRLILLVSYFVALRPVNLAIFDHGNTHTKRVTT